MPLELDGVRAAIAKALAAKAFPGGVLVAAHEGSVVVREAFGVRAYGQYAGVFGADDPAPVTLETVYDVASVTKAAATTAVLMRLVADGKVELDAPAQRWLPELAQPGADQIRVRHLLSHSAGLLWWKPFYEEIAQGDRLAALVSAGQTPLERAPGSGSVYSDLSFISLGFIAERAGGGRLDHLHRRLVTEPLGLTGMGFRPLGEPVSSREPIAPTEDCPRRGLLWGEVHDDNAHRMGGVAGHAGLFARAEQLVELGLRLAEAHEGKAGLFAPEVVREFLTPAGVPGSTWRLGFDGPALTAGSQVGDRLARTASLHLGFTGCSWVIDPPRGLVIALLTNRVHPTRETLVYKEHRPLIHDALLAALEPA